MTDRVLLVDDEPRLLDGLRRTLRGRYEVHTANSGAEGLAVLAASLTEPDPFAVVVSDMMMPGMNGADFLTKAREVVPDAVPMILSGQADLTSTISAVNNANLFRFLTKPCEPDDLTRALDAALRQYQLVRSERELLEQTLAGAVDVLTDVLSMASPQASLRTARVRSIVAAVSAALDLDDDWRLPIAAMLSHVGCVAVPGPVLEQFGSGTTLSPVELEMVLKHPATGRRLLQRIPRLHEVADWVGSQPVDAAAACAPGATTDDPAGSVLAAVSATLVLTATGISPRDVVRRLTETGRYSYELLEAVVAAVEDLEPKGEPRQVLAVQLRVKMLLDEDLRTANGMVLARRGERLSETLIERVSNFARSVGIAEPIKVLDPT